MDADTHTYMHAYILYGEVTVYWTYNYIINNIYLTVPINKVLYLKGSTSFHSQATYRSMYYHLLFAGKKPTHREVKQLTQDTWPISFLLSHMKFTLLIS